MSRGRKSIKIYGRRGGGGAGSQGGRAVTRGIGVAGPGVTCVVGSVGLVRRAGKFSGGGG